MHGIGTANTFTTRSKELWQIVCWIFWWFDSHKWRCHSTVYHGIWFYTIIHFRPYRILQRDSFYTWARPWISKLVMAPHQLLFWLPACTYCMSTKFFSSDWSTPRHYWHRAFTQHVSFMATNMCNNLPKIALPLMHLHAMMPCAWPWHKQRSIPNWRHIWRQNWPIWRCKPCNKRKACASKCMWCKKQVHGCKMSKRVYWRGAPWRWKMHGCNKTRHWKWSKCAFCSLLWNG